MTIDHTITLFDWTLGLMAGLAVVLALAFIIVLADGVWQEWKRRKKKP